MSFENRAIESLRNSTDWITSQRWFGDKARPVTGAEPETLQLVDLVGTKAALAIVRFSFEWGADSLYFVPLIDAKGSKDAPEGVADALSDPTFLRWFIDGFAEGRSIGDEAVFAWRGLGTSIPDAGNVDYASAKAISGEQSNTSIVFDRKFIGKMFRRVQPGLNPDLEIGEFLSTADRFAHAPKLYGLVEVERGGESIAVAAMQEFVPNHADGWTWFLSQLRLMSDDTIDGLLDAARLLARRTGELHVALASDGEDPAFAPEPFESPDAQALIGRVIAEIDESVEGLVRHLSPAEVERIHKAMGALMGNAYSLEGTYKIRVHGDYHLGQTLRTVDDDFMLIDFEGEPLRTMDERRIKLPALKDVAGMVRSLDYAAATILQDDPGEERRTLRDRWLQQATDAYVSAYRETVANASVPIVPDDDKRFTDALNLMIAEKALYEVRYELNNRPAWLSIPLNALRSLVGIDTAERAGQEQSAS